MKRLIYLPLGILILTFCSCKKFLQEYSQDLTYAKSASDLNELLLGSGYESGTSMEFLNVMDDDETVYINSPTTLTDDGYHYWQKYPSSMFGTAYADNCWAPLYQSIAVVNVVIPKDESFKSDPLYLKVKGEAYFIRAKNYFELVNLYAKPYAAATASQDAGVPLKLTEYVEDKYFSRNSVQDVYNSIIADLKQSIICLKGINQTSAYRANEWAARGLLARTYLYMGQWQQASDQCDSILASGKYSLMNLNAQAETVSFLNTDSHEIIFTDLNNYESSVQARYDSDIYAYLATYMPSPELLGLYQPNDLRFKFSFIPAINTPRYVYQKLRLDDTKMVSDIFSIRLAEIYLMKAETMAKLNRANDAINYLKTLRQNRMQNGDPGNLNFTGSALVDTIRNERRRELCFEGQRWFDLRRYAVDPNYPQTKVITHPYYEALSFGSVQQTGNYVLNTYDVDHNAYVFPIPQTEIVVNNGVLIDNPRDNRPLK